MKFTRLEENLDQLKSQKNLLVLIRHGQSTWNAKSQFTGWANIGLNEIGKKEAVDAGEKWKELRFDMAFTSVLARANRTLDIFLESAGHPEIEIIREWALNERDYGELTGLNKNQVKEEVGEEKFKLWRRSYDVPPPGGESLKMTEERSWPYFRDHILPHLQKGKKIIISAHGNSLRAIVKNLENISVDKISSLEVPHVEPWFYTLGE